MESIQWDVLASESVNFSGSDLGNLVNDAALLAARAKNSLVEQIHFEQALRRTQAMKGQADLTGGKESRAPLVQFPYGPLN